MPAQIFRVAMWSGPRNISTAMMRSFGNRSDCVVVDEPLYSCYLASSSKPHPGAGEIIAAGETDWRKVVSALTNDTPRGAVVYYQKHMTHHLLPEMSRDWMASLTNCFLIRHPREVLASYSKVIETPTLADTGFPQQAEIYDFVRATTGQTPPVLDAADILKNPRRLLGMICDALGIDFQDAMLSWPPGLRATDGIWAKHWYSEVEKSTGFRPYTERRIELPERLENLAAECARFYERLHDARLK
jgi:hypothetical protein